MANKAFIGPLLPVYLGVPGPQVAYDNFIVIDSDDNAAGAPPDDTIISASEVPLVHDDTTESIKAKIVADIRSMYSDPTLECVFISEFDRLGEQVTLVSPSRSLNSAFRPSTTKAALVCYTVELAVASTLLAGASASVQLFSDASNPPTSVHDEAKIATGALLGLSNTVRQTLVTFVPAGSYVKLVSATTGNGTATLVNVREVLFSE